MKQLLDKLAGQTVLLRASQSPLEAALLGAFVTARARVVRLASSAAEITELERLAAHGTKALALVVPFRFEGSMESMGEEAFQLIHLLQETKKRLGALPRYALGIVPTPASPEARVGRAIAKTLASYAAAHASEEDLRVNILRLDGAACPRLYARASSASLALTSGWLDAVRGQELVIGAD
ncbi:MAG: hypothetical protein U1E65_01810 [Myxococcota bacterium]